MKFIYIKSKQIVTIIKNQLNEKIDQRPKTKTRKNIILVQNNTIDYAPMIIVMQTNVSLVYGNFVLFHQLCHLFYFDPKNCTMSSALISSMK
jgi:hypothetical protein